MYNGWETHLVKTAIKKRLEEVRSELVNTPLSSMHKIMELKAEIEKNEIMLDKLNAAAGLGSTPADSCN
ncbi:hypothetical protein EDC56_1314 [Sinobacterium caligoides]|uniref:Uncharacterized protein n=1 Tax=Sinobacterium caligoides TaxID=933926 RepID=A0A3N2E1F6_9GAMM|nr:hypothetical protein [Sinobacterium caligoides]ROS05762.1 hypothetical protein EDC56_1314 [Sinobacterium caligoides]